MPAIVIASASSMLPPGVSPAAGTVGAAVAPSVAAAVPSLGDAPGTLTLGSRDGPAPGSAVAAGFVAAAEAPGVPLVAGALAPGVGVGPGAPSSGS